MGGLIKKLLIFAAAVAVAAVILTVVFAFASKLPDGLGLIVVAVTAVIAVIVVLRLVGRR